MPIERPVRPSEAATEINPEILNNITLTLAEVRNRVKLVTVDKDKKKLSTIAAKVASTRHMRVADAKLTKVAVAVIAVVAALLTAQIIVSQYQIHHLSARVADLETQIKKPNS